MQPVTFERFVAMSERFEGIVPWMYLDVRGLVTVGIGCLIDPVALAVTLPFWHAGKPATKQAIHAEWHAVKARKELAQHGAKAARQYCDLRLTADGVRALLRRRLEANERYLAQRHFPCLQTWPENAQLAIALIAWACGAGFPASWPSFRAAALAEDWALASKHATISTRGNPGIVPRNQAIQELLTSC